jgi:hypothetical protein
MPGDTRSRAAFLGGMATMLAIAGLLIGFAGWRLGGRELRRQAMNVVVPGSGDGGLLPPLPQDLLRELTTLGAVMDNAENPTHANGHDNLLVRPDADRVYALRANARVDAYMLATGRMLNLDPPVLYVHPEASMSAALQLWVQQNTRLRYSFTVDAQGFRRTVPPVESPRKILLVGDSVLFGVGVDDDATMASALQRQVGRSLQVVNAGVGEYGLDEIFRTADTLSSHDTYEALIYIACQNDFDESSAETFVASATQMLERLARLGPRVHNRLAIFLQADMEYTTYDVLGRLGWSRERKAMTDRLRIDLPPAAKGLGFSYADWAELVAHTPQADGSLFQRFGLYVDHVHLSPRGNLLAAREIHRLLAAWGLVGS